MVARNDSFFDKPDTRGDERPPPLLLRRICAIWDISNAYGRLNAYRASCAVYLVKNQEHREVQNRIYGKVKKRLDKFCADAYLVNREIIST